MIETIISKFIIEGKYIEGKPFGSGHINETFLITIESKNKIQKFILRKINRNVFKHPQILVNNTVKVTDHLRNKFDSCEIDRRVLCLVKTEDNNFCFVDKQGEYWCLLVFISDAYTINNVATTQQAFNAAYAFGNFANQLNDLPLSEIKDSIPNFHNVQNRLKQFDNAQQSDEFDRVRFVDDELISVSENREISKKLTDLLNEKDLPTRIIHNDTKISNVMFDNKTGEALAVIDLDTVMQGSVLYDFGDMVRSYTNSAQEDDSNLEHVNLRMNIFESIVNGYLTGTKSILTKLEIDNLILGAEAIVYEQAVRFLTDHLINDVYYTIKYENHNLDRARNQLALLKSIQNQKDEMSAIIKKYSN